jgi:hypothetical protein
MTELSNKFNNPPGAISPKEYFDLCVQLLNEGVSAFKTENARGYQMKNIKTETLKRAAPEAELEHETDREIEVAKDFLLIDMAEYPLDSQSQMLVVEMGKNWGERVARQSDEGYDLSKYGIYVNAPHKVLADYARSDEDPSLLVPNPEATRFCLKVDNTIKIPVTWGTFDLNAGAHFVIREKDVAGLISAVQDIQSGKETIEGALYTQDAKGNTISRFDIYGTMPGFFEDNYSFVPLKPETEARLAAFRAQGPALPSPQLV